MPRIRTIKPDFPQSQSVGNLSRDARLLFIQIWTLVDDEGRARATSRMLASLLYPYDDDAKHLIDGWLGELEQSGCIRRYEVDSHHYLDIPKWLNHQKIDRPTPSKLPPFAEGSLITREGSRSLPVGREGKGEDKKERSFPSERAIPFEDEPLTEPPYDLGDADIVPEANALPAQKTAPPAIDAMPEQTGTKKSPKAMLYDRAKKLMGPKAGMAMGQLIKLMGEDCLRLSKVLDLAAGAADPGVYVFGVVKNERQRIRQVELDDAQVASWRPVGGLYPDCDSHGYYIKSAVDGKKHLYLDGDTVQRLVGHQRMEHCVG